MLFTVSSTGGFFRKPYSAHVSSASGFIDFIDPWLREEKCLYMAIPRFQKSANMT